MVSYAISPGDNLSSPCAAFDIMWMTLFMSIPVTFLPKHLMIAGINFPTTADPIVFAAYVSCTYDKYMSMIVIKIIDFIFLNFCFW